MNFVGHAYIAKNHPQLIAGNFAGDSYKGNLENFSHLPDHILKGIELHRYIDNFTDSSHHIKSVSKIFQNEGISKVAYIASDIILDHFITKNWANFSNEKYADFVQTIYHHTDKNLMHLEEDFCFMFERLKEQKWLFQYHTEEGIDIILWQFSRRLNFENDLTKSMLVYQANKTEIDFHFANFMTAIVENSQTFIANKLI